MRTNLSRRRQCPFAISRTGKAVAAALGLATATAAVSLVMPAPRQALAKRAALVADWPLLRGDAQRSGVSSESDVRPPFSLLWRFTGDPQASNPCAPAVVGNTAYFATGSARAGSTSGGGVVYAVDVRTGAQKWRYPGTGGLAGQAFTTAPLVQDGKLYIGASDGKLYILNADSGALVQTYQTGGPILSSPIIYNDILLFGSNDDTLYALNANESSLPSAWRAPYRTKDNINSAPIVADGVTFFTTADQFLYAVAAATGRQMWSFRLPFVTMNNGPVYADSTLFVPSGPRLFAFLPRSGGTRWTQILSTDIAVPPVAEGGIVYVVDKDRRMYAFTANRGRPAAGWETPITLPYTVIAPPTIIRGQNENDPGVLLVPTSRNLILCLSRADGKVLWEYALDPATNRLVLPPTLTAITAPLAVANGAVYALSDDGSLSAFRRDAPDSTAPDVRNLYPRPGTAVSGQGSLTFAAQVEDFGSGVDPDSIQMVLEGQALETSYDRDRKLVYYRSQGRTGGASSALPNGRKTVTLTVKDWQGNTQTQTWGFTIDNSLPATVDRTAPSAPRVTTPRSPAGGAPGAGRPGGNRPGGLGGNRPRGGLGGTRGGGRGSGL